MSFDYLRLNPLKLKHIPGAEKRSARLKEKFFEFKNVDFPVLEEKFVI
jgi:hypothetical protein